ncbi:PilZ domain-containing protein [Helicovermis profundi]|uniref:PilZ domain-containing protein n=1 Tax=Helicovermis profundi TaxID=3065157 RepID=A0AAU9E644_9FIRM|nr:hypothetical protein HLPR_04330 [Clostridia bacterium S502]
MLEKRRAERLPFMMTLRVESLYKQNNEVIDDIKEDLEITDISKTGIGFSSHVEMPLGYYFNANIQLEEEKHFFSVLKIIRKNDGKGEFHYGCEFVGLADILSSAVDEYKEDKNL